MKASRQTTTYRRRAIRASIAAGVIALASPQGFACGYDDPQSLSRGSLNWSYPDSLHVVGAISREVAARRLPIANFDSSGLDLFGHKFLLAKTSIEQFGTALRAASPERLQSSVAVVLVEPMLWARFQPTSTGLQTIVHVSGAERGDLVVITGEAVIAEIVARRLTFAEAYARGIARLYGDETQIAALVGIAGRVGASRAALDSEARAAPIADSLDAEATFLCGPRSMGRPHSRCSTK